MYRSVMGSWCSEVHDTLWRYGHLIGEYPVASFLALVVVCAVVSALIDVCRGSR